MTQENRENMHRAIGIIEGVAWCADDKVADALCVVCEILSAVMQSEEKADAV